MVCHTGALVICPQPGLSPREKVTSGCMRDMRHCSMTRPVYKQNVPPAVMWRTQCVGCLYKVIIGCVILVPYS